MSNMYRLNMGTKRETEHDTDVLEETKTPSLYKVLLLNDDFTPMEFVVYVLKKFFNKEETEATEIMLQVHHQGYGVAGIFSYEIAEMKVLQVNAFAQKHEHPLKCTMEKE